MIKKQNNTRTVVSTTNPTEKELKIIQTKGAQRNFEKKTQEWKRNDENERKKNEEI